MSHVTVRSRHTASGAAHGYKDKMHTPNSACQMLLVCPPVQGGVYDFVTTLKDALDKSFGIEGRAERLEISKEAPTIPIVSGLVPIVQYSGYGYEKRGSPWWLLTEVKRYKQSGHKIGIYFHELYAFGPPWRSSFWLSLMQRHICRELASMADFWVTNRAQSLKWLCQFAGDRPHACLPVFSNVGESPLFIGSRASKLVVFGSAGLRLSTYRKAGTSFFAWIKERGIELHDIGPAFCEPKIEGQLRAAEAVVHGRLSPQGVSEQLADSRFGLVTYPLEYAAKSSVLAAYCAHGVCPILLAGGYAPSDGLIAGKTYLVGNTWMELSESHAEEVARAAWDWFQPHRVGVHVETLKNFVAGVDAGVR